MQDGRTRLTLQDEHKWRPLLASQAPMPCQSIDSCKKKRESRLFTKLIDRQHCLMVGLCPPDSLPSVVDKAAMPTNELRSDCGTAYRLCLFKTNFSADTILEATICLTACPFAKGMSVGFYTACLSPGSSKVDYVEHEIDCHEDLQTQSPVCTITGTKPDARIVELGISCRRFREVLEPIPLIYLHRILVQERSRAQHRWEIGDLKLVERLAGSYCEKRLSWNFEGVEEHWPKSLPWSTMTGPFSSFSIWIEGREIGQSHCLEFPIWPEDCGVQGRTESSCINTQVKGRLFDGGIVLSAIVAMSMEDLAIAT